jgi:transcription termination/antitermination protein NusG
MVNINWFVLQTIVGKEQKSVELLSKINLTSLKPFLPKKKIKIKKNKITKDVILPLYPGYIFILGDWDFTDAKNILLVPGVIKFVGGVKNPGRLLDEEKTLILKLTKDGVINYSKVVNDGSRIKIISGPLKDMEGTIESVDRRKQRAVVRLTLLNRLIKVSLGFEIIESDEKTK